MAPTLESVAEAHARRQKQLAQRTSARLLALWRQIDRNNIGASWRLLVPDALATLVTSQATAAAAAGIYVEDCLEKQKLFMEAEGRVVSTALSGVASDGRNLANLLYRPAVTTLLSIQQGAPVPRAMAAGTMALDIITRTQVADAGRAGESIAIVARPKVQGFIRMLSQPSCSRCVILAGRWYRWNAGFRRHPRCDCRSIPAQENTAGDLTTDPKKAFEAMPAAEQERVFGKADAEAIRDGADINKVVNARRGMETATVFGRPTQITREGAGRGPVRLMPEQILRDAKGNRGEAIRLLRQHGYIL